MSHTRKSLVIVSVLHGWNNITPMLLEVDSAKCDIEELEKIRKSLSMDPTLLSNIHKVRNEIKKRLIKRELNESDEPPLFELLSEGDLKNCDEDLGCFLRSLIGLLREEHPKVYQYHLKKGQLIVETAKYNNILDRLIAPHKGTVVANFHKDDVSVLISGSQCGKTNAKIEHRTGSWTLTLDYNGHFQPKKHNVKIESYMTKIVRFF